MSDGPDEPITDATTAEVSGTSAHNQTPFGEGTNGVAEDPEPPAKPKRKSASSEATPESTPEPTSEAVPAEAQAEESYSGSIDLTGSGNDADAEAPATSPEEAEKAQALASETAKSDNDWRTENPNEAYVREPVEGVGGESFTYGGKA